MKIFLPAYLLLFFSLTSCFEKDERQLPYVANGKSFTLTESMYTHQIFYDFNTNAAISDNLVSSWDIAFEAATPGWHIHINTGNYLAAQNLHITDLASTSYTTDPKGWIYDSSSGNPDSLAIGSWVDSTGAANIYTHDVYLIGKYNGVKYNAFKKITFEDVNDTSYTISWAEPSSSLLHQAILHKQPGFNYIYFSFDQGGAQVQVEPPRDTWDILFTQYTTTLYTDAGVPTPYFVRGTLLNPYQTEASLDTTKQFDLITLQVAEGFVYSSRTDYIGYDWKKVTVDEGSNQATYEVRKGHNYLIHNSKDEYFKMKFVSYYDSIGNPGYPSFEFDKLN